MLASLHAQVASAFALDVASLLGDPHQPIKSLCQAAGLTDGTGLHCDAVPLLRSLDQLLYLTHLLEARHYAALAVFTSATPSCICELQGMQRATCASSFAVTLGAALRPTFNQHMPSACTPHPCHTLPAMLACLMSTCLPACLQALERRHATLLWPLCGTSS